MELLQRLHQALDDHGARPSDSSSIISSSGRQHERPRRRQLLLLTAGQRPGELRLALGDPREVLHDALGLALVLVLGLVEVAAHPQVLADGERREQAPAPGDVSDAELHAVLGVHLRDVLALPEHLALRRVDEAGHGLEDRGLAGAVRPEQRDALALVHDEVDVVQHLHLAVVDVQTLRLEHRRRLASSLRLTIAGRSSPHRA